MPTFIKGTGQPRLLREGSVTTDKYGLSTASAEWWAYLEHDLRLVTGLGKGHPSYGSLVCERMVVTGTSGGGYSLVASYAGLIGSPSPVDELDTCVTEAPIETHPNFAAFAGTSKETALNGAIFLTDPDSGQQYFDRFGPSAPPSFRGVTSYYIPTAISRHTYISNSEPDAGSVGTRQSPPQTFGISGDWLFYGVTAEKRGNVYTVREEWKAAGPRGWNTTIYPS